MSTKPPRPLVTKPPRPVDVVEADIAAVTARLAEPNIKDAVRSSNRQRRDILNAELVAARAAQTAQEVLPCAS